MHRSLSILMENQKTQKVQSKQRMETAAANKCTPRQEENFRQSSMENEPVATLVATIVRATEAIIIDSDQEVAEVVVVAIERISVEIKSAIAFV